MVDRRVRQHALHVALAEGHERAEHQGQHGQGVDDGPPVALITPKDEKSTRSMAAKAPALATAAMKPVTGDGRALVHVGRPHVEGHRRHLEGEADQQERQPGQQQAVGSTTFLERKSAIWVRFVEPVAP